jgi:hypothetical protein
VIRRGIVASIGETTIWRWLSRDAIRPWTHRSWIFPRDTPRLPRYSGFVLWAAYADKQGVTPPSDLRGESPVNEPVRIGSSITLAQQLEALNAATFKASEILNGTRLVARPFLSPAPSRNLALAARRTSPRRRDADLLADFFIEQRRAGRAGAAAPRHRPKA